MNGNPATGTREGEIIAASLLFQRRLEKASQEYRTQLAAKARQLRADAIQAGAVDARIYRVADQLERLAGNGA